MRWEAHMLADIKRTEEIVYKAMGYYISDTPANKKEQEEANAELTHVKTTLTGMRTLMEALLNDGVNL